MFLITYDYYRIVNRIITTMNLDMRNNNTMLYIYTEYNCSNYISLIHLIITMKTYLHVIFRCSSVYMDWVCY